MKKMGVLTDYRDGQAYLDYVRQNEESAKSPADLMGWNK